MKRIEAKAATASNEDAAPTQWKKGTENEIFRERKESERGNHLPPAAVALSLDKWTVPRRLTIAAFLQKRAGGRELWLRNVLDRLKIVVQEAGKKDWSSVLSEEGIGICIYCKKHFPVVSEEPTAPLLINSFAHHCLHKLFWLSVLTHTNLRTPDDCCLKRKKTDHNACSHQSTNLETISAGNSEGYSILKFQEEE